MIEYLLSRRAMFSRIAAVLAITYTAPTLIAQAVERGMITILPPDVLPVCDADIDIELLDFVYKCRLIGGEAELSKVNVFVIANRLETRSLVSHYVTCKALFWCNETLRNKTKQWLGLLKQYDREKANNFTRRIVEMLDVMDHCDPAEKALYEEKFFGRGTQAYMRQLAKKYTPKTIDAEVLYRGSPVELAFT